MGRVESRFGGPSASEEGRPEPTAEKTAARMVPEAALAGLPPRKHAACISLQNYSL